VESENSNAKYEPMTEQEATDLLSTHEVGRIAWQTVEGPVIFPVAYAFDKGVLVFRTAEQGVLAELAAERLVAFQIDEIDVGAASGWSVLVRATSSRLADSGEDGTPQTPLPVPWATGERDLVIQLDPLAISGRVVVRG
jgi:nitroimidazol reductase NimA-like FMN-containing flavoprotein (pyridoxamine 5'-phosphate oxidase superfamily)